MKASDICLSASRRMWSWSKALLPQSCGAWSGIVLLWYFMWAPTGQCWSPPWQSQTHLQVLVIPWHSQTGTFSPLEVGAVEKQGICPGHCFTSCPQTCPCLSLSTLFPEARGLRWFFLRIAVSSGERGLGWPMLCPTGSSSAELGVEEQKRVSMLQ